MLNENAIAWVAAIRSGKYEQGKTVLHMPAIPARSRALVAQGETFCCLGVACDLYIAAHPDTARWTNQTNADDTPFSACVVNGVRNTAVLPSEVSEWLGLAPYDVGGVNEVNEFGDFIDREGQPNTLTSVNDHEGSSFAQIADLIASHPKGLFLA